MTFKAKFVQDGRSIDHTPASAVAAGDVVVIGSNLVTIAKLDIAANELGAVATEGVFEVAKDASDIGGPGPAYWDADGDPVGGTAGSGAFTSNPALGPFAGWFLEAAGSGEDTVRMALNSRDSAVAPARSSLVQDDDQPYPIELAALRVWDAPQTNIPGTPASDDLGLIYNTFGTAPPSVETGDLKAAGATTRRVGFQFQVPPEYVAGQSITLRLNAGMKTTVADTSATIDAEVHRNGAGADLVATAAQSINSLTAANKDFVITPTTVVPGDILDVRVSIAVNDAATATPVIGKWNIAASALLLDIKG